MRLGQARAGIFLLLLFSCGRSAREPRWTTSIDTLSSGQIHVVNSPPTEGPGPTWTLQEVLRIGSVDQPGPSSFAELKGLVVTEKRQVVVLDAQSQELRVFEPFGAHLATFGGKGGGPGELQAAWGLMLAPDGKLWVPDQRNARMSVFNPETGFIESFPLHVLRFAYVWAGAMTTDGHILKPSITLGPPRRPILRVYDREMSLVDSLPLPEPPPYNRTDPPGAFYWEAPGGAAMGYVGVPFYPQGQDLLDPRGGVWTREAGEFAYRIKRWIPGGDTTLVLETHRPEFAIPTSVRDSVIDAIRAQLQERGGARQDWSKVPYVKPAVTSMFLTAEGRLWVQTASPDSVLTFDVYSPGGVYQGTVITSLHIFPWLSPVVRGSELWAVVTDEFDVPYVTHARIINATETAGG